MKVTGIIGFILILLGDLALFFTSMNMPAGSKTSLVFLIFTLLTLVLVIIYFIAALKAVKGLRIGSSIVLLISPIIAFFITGSRFQQDTAQYGRYLNDDSAFKAFIILVILEIIFGIIGLILSIIENKNKNCN